MIGDCRIGPFGAAMSYAKIESVKMKGVLDGSGIDESPANGITLSQIQSIVVGPRFTVEDERTLEWFGAIGITVEPFGD